MSQALRGDMVRMSHRVLELHIEIHGPTPDTARLRADLDSVRVDMLRITDRYKQLQNTDAEWLTKFVSPLLLVVTQLAMASKLRMEMLLA